MAFDKRPVTHALALMHAHSAFLAEWVGHFPERWENKAGFNIESGEKVAKNSVREMITMLTEHMREHILMIEKIIVLNKG